MKEALLKKRYGIPAALLLVLLLSGTVLAWYCFANSPTSTTTVQEALSPANEVDFKQFMYPGDTNTWSFDIQNVAPITYTVKADLTFSAPDNVSITSFVVTYPNETTKNKTSDLLDDNSTTFGIPADGVVSCEMTIKATKGATTGEVEASFNLYRQ